MRDSWEAMQRTQLDGEGPGLSLRLWGGGRGTCRESGPQAPEFSEGRSTSITSKDTVMSLAREDTALSSKNKDISFYLREIFFLFLYTFFSSRK